MATNRTQEDWERIEKEYRAGMVSVRKIARDNNISHTAIQLKAKECSWDRDLSAKIQAELASKELSMQVATDPKLATEIVETTVDEIRGVLHNQRKNARKQQDIIRKLTSELNERMSGETLSLDDIKACALIMNNLTQAFARLVTIERISYGLEDGSNFNVETGDSTIKRIVVNFVKADITNNYGENSRAIRESTSEAAIPVQ